MIKVVPCPDCGEDNELEVLDNPSVDWICACAYIGLPEGEEPEEHHTTSFGVDEEGNVL